MEKSLKQKLSEAIRDRVAVRLEAGETAARQIRDDIADLHPNLVSALGKVLALERIRDMASDAMRRAGAVTRDSAEQFDLPLEFSGLRIPAAISFPSDDEDGIHWIALKRAQMVHMLKHRELLQNQIAADTESFNTFEALWKYVAPIMEAQPDLTLGEALAAGREQVA